MTNEYESCRINLENLIRWYTPAHRNEATTRLQLIDRLFFECLSWSRNDVVLEEPYGRDYTDYTFSAPRRILIVEAKKEDSYFEIPVGRNRLEYSIPTLLRDYSNLKAAIEQAARYCQTRGVQFGAVCNGYQIVAFVAARSDGLAPLEGKALVFPSLEFMLENFLDLWQALSKPGIEEKKLLSRLLGDTLLPQLPRKLAVNISTYPGIKARNIFQTDLQTVSDLVIEDITRSDDLETHFLIECYCRSGALSQYSQISKTILETRYSALFDSNSPGPTIVPAVIKQVNKQGKKSQKEEQIISPELLAESLSRRPILLIGDVGAGKTTFILNLTKVDAADIFKNAITLYIDLGSQATLSTDLRLFVPSEITLQLRDNYEIDIEERNFVRGVYNIDLQRFRTGIYSDLYETNQTAYREKEINLLEQKLSNQEQHLKHSLQHISKGRKKQIVIFLDNADQRDDQTQQQTFLIAQEMSEHWPVTVFVSLRPETFHRSKKIGALSGYHSKAFTISPPRIDLVIEKRLNFALKITRGEIPIQLIPRGIGVRLNKLELIICAFLHSLEASDDIGEFIDNIAGGNVRLALDLVKEFFGSGHVDTQKIFDIYSKTRKYNIPLHEFLRAVIFGDAIYYEPNRSPIGNLFDISSNDPKEHFLLPLLIGLVSSSSISSSKEGFVETSDIYDHLQGIGFTPEQIDEALIRGYRKKLIETSARRIPEPGQVMPQELRATTVGVYHINRLCHLFAYIDAVIVDTPVLDSRIRELISDVHEITERLDRAEIFRQYLDTQWLTLSSSKMGFNWNVASTDLRVQIEYIRNRVGAAEW
jgi:GTPase SAR1 family protein